MITNVYLVVKIEPHSTQRIAASRSQVVRLAGYPEPMEIVVPSNLKTVAMEDLTRVLEDSFRTVDVTMDGPTGLLVRYGLNEFPLGSPLDQFVNLVADEMETVRARYEANQPALQHA